MFDSICVFKNRVFIVDLETNLISYKYLKHGKNGKNFEEKFRLKIPLPMTFQMKNTVLDVVENYVIGLKCIVIVAISVSNEISAYLFSGSGKNNLLHIITSDLSSFPTVEPNCNLFITHGPTLLFSSAYDQHLWTLSYKTEFYWHSPINTPLDKPCKVMQVSCIGQLSLNDPINVFLFVQSTENPYNCRSVCVSCLGIKIKQNRDPVIHNKLPLHFFFPTDFQNEAKIIHIWNISITNINSTNLEALNFKSNNAFVITETGAFLFCNGILQYVLEQPGLNVFNINTEFFNLSPGSMNLILTSETKEVYFVTNCDSFTKKFSLQISKTWPNIKSVLCGNILMNYSKQLILLKNSCDDWQDDCIISNFSGLAFVDCISKNLENESNMSRAIPAIQAKILSGNTAITKVQSSILRKMEGTLDSLQKLNTCGSVNIQTNHHISSFQQSLVDLILCTDEVNHPKDNAEIRVKLKLLKHWKKFFDDHWVLCWTFNNDDERTIYNPVMNIWISGSHTQSFQKVFVHKSHTFSIEDECHKEIKSKEHFSILVSFKTFKFNYDYLKVHAVLSWYVGSGTEFENELFLVLEEKTLIQQQMLFLTDLFISDVFDPKFKDISTLEDLACLKIWQQRVVFTFTSFRTNLQNIETFFPNISYFTLAPHLEKAYLKIFKEDYSFLYGVHIVFKTLNHSTVEAEAFVKNEDQLLLLEKHFYLHLSTDVLILPNGLSALEITQLKQQAVCFMKDEIDLLLSMMNIYNVQWNFEKFSFQPETVVMSKKNFLRLRKTLLKKECRTDNIMQKLSNLNFFKKTI